MLGTMPEDLVAQFSKLILCVYLPAIACLGMLLHYFFCRRLSFFNFNDTDSSGNKSVNCTNKKSPKRIIIPLVIVGGMSIILPFCVEYCVPNLREVLSREDLELHEYIRIPWSWFLPIISKQITILTCLIVGILYYFIIGLLCRSGSKLIKSK